MVDPVGLNFLKSYKLKHLSKSNFFFSINSVKFRGMTITGPTCESHKHSFKNCMVKEMDFAE